MTPPAVEPTTRLLRERIRRVFRYLPKALAGEEEPLHQMRVASRRLRVALPLLARKPEGRRARRSLRLLRRMTRTAGASRDLDVAVALLADHLDKQQQSPAAGLLLKRLKAARRRSRNRMADGLMDIEIARVRRDLRALLRRGGANLFEVFGRLRHLRDGQGGSLLSALEAMGEDYDTEALHRVRIQARRLRYAAEVADALRGQQSEAAPLFKELQERLGRIRDLFVLSAWLGRQATASQSRGQTELANEARSLEAWSLEESRRQHQVLLQARPADTARRALEALGRGRTSAA